MQITYHEVLIFLRRYILPLHIEHRCERLDDLKIAECPPLRPRGRRMESIPV